MAADLERSEPRPRRRNRRTGGLTYCQQLRDSALYHLRCPPYRVFSFRRRKPIDTLRFSEGEHEISAGKSDFLPKMNRLRATQSEQEMVSGSLESNTFSGTGRVEVVDLTEQADDDETRVSADNTRKPSSLNEKQLETMRHIRRHQERVREEEIAAQLDRISLQTNFEDELDDVQKRISQLMIEKPLTAKREELTQAALKAKLRALDDLHLFNEILSMPRSHVHIKKFNQIITTEMLSCLRDGQWLNDEIINFQVSLMQERNTKTKKAPTIFFHNSFFFTKLMANGIYKYSNVSRWTKRKKVDIFACDMVIFPVHVLGNHWCLGVIDFSKKELVYYDSFGGRNSEFFSSCRRYIQDEHQDKKEQVLKLTGWKDVVPKDIPLQDNGCDCGVFALKFADYISEGLPLSFSPKNMSYFRRRILLEIVNGALF